MFLIGCRKLLYKLICQFIVEFELSLYFCLHLQSSVLSILILFFIASDDEEESFNSDALVTQIVLAIGVIMVVLAIAICILLSCRNLRYRNCDTSSQRSSPRTVQTEVVEGETTRPVSMAPELDSLIGSCHKHPGIMQCYTFNRCKTYMK